MQHTFLKTFPVLLLTFFLAACTSSDDTSGQGETNTSTQTYDVRVERGNLLGGTVRDAAGQVATQKDPGVPVYTFETDPVMPIRVTGGWVDMNGDGERNGYDFNLTVEMHSCNRRVITPLTSLVPETCTLEDVQETYNRFRGIIENDLDLSERDFFSETISGMNNRAFTLFTNAVYRALAGGEVSYGAIDDEYLRLRTRAEELHQAFPESNETILIEVESTKDLAAVTPDPDALRALYTQLENENCGPDEVLVPREHMAGYDPEAFADPAHADLLEYTECIAVECEGFYAAEGRMCAFDDMACSWMPARAVCGSKDGIEQTYSKMCRLVGDGAELLYEHACVTCEEGYTLNMETYTCDPVPVTCSDEFDPVCGEKGGVRATYDNQCKMEQAGAALVLDDACNALTCETGYALNTETYRCEPVPVTCSDNYDPVCGQKGGVRSTYDNACKMEQAGATLVFDDACSAQTCPTGQTLNEAYFCEDIECDPMYELVGNECVLKTCDPGYELQENGECQCANTAPVYASSGDSCQQYENECAVPDGWTVVDECPAPAYEITDNPVDIVNAHNYYRAEVFAGSQLSWDNTLQQDAQDWADYLSVNYTEADFQAGTPPHAALFQPDEHEYDLFEGENIYMTTQYPNEVAIVTAIEAFAAEKPYYHYDTNSCDEGQICGHYTQIIWKETSIVGCAEAQMQTDLRFNTVIVCRYYYPGNWVGERPY